MTRKGGFLKGIVTSAATYAVKTAVDIAVNPENMQKVAQLVSEQQVGSKLKQAAANMHLPAALSPSARVTKQLDTIEETLEKYADRFPVNAPVERWKSTLQSLRLMDTMNRSQPAASIRTAWKSSRHRPRPCSMRSSSPLTRAMPRSKTDHFSTACIPVPRHSQAHRRTYRSYTATRWI